MEKVLLHFDELSFNSLMGKLRRAQSDTQKLVDQINAICSFKVDQSAFLDILQSRGEMAGNRIEKTLNEELDSIKIRSASIRKAAIKGDLETYYALVKTFYRPDSLLWPYLSINEEGKVCVSPQAENEAREQFSNYIKTEKGLEMYVAHKKMIKAMNEFIATSRVVNGMNLTNFFKPVFGDTRIDMPDEVDYDRLTNV